MAGELLMVQPPANKKTTGTKKRNNCGSYLHLPEVPEVGTFFPLIAYENLYFLIKGISFQVPATTGKPCFSRATATSFAGRCRRLSEVVDMRQTYKPYTRLPAPCTPPQ